VSTTIALAAGKKIVFSPKPGTTVPYTFEVRIAGQAQAAMAQGQSMDLTSTYHGKFVDKVEDANQRGERLLSRTFSEVFAKEGPPDGDGEEKDILSTLASASFQYVRDARARLLAIDDKPVSELSLMELLDVQHQSMNPVLLCHIFAPVVPYPTAEVSPGMQWEAGPDLQILKDIKSVEAPTTLQEVKTIDGIEFAIITSKLSLTIDTPLALQGAPQGTPALNLKAQIKGDLKQWSSTANGLVARTELEGEMIAGLGPANGQPLFVIKVDKLAAIVMYDKEAQQ
jgi:hypothetical protein